MRRVSARLAPVRCASERYESTEAPLVVTGTSVGTGTSGVTGTSGRVTSGVAGTSRVTGTSVATGVSDETGVSVATGASTAASSTGVGPGVVEEHAASAIARSDNTP